MGTSETVRNVLLALLRGCLWERRVEPLSLFPLPQTSWEELYKLARQQTVTGVTFRGLYYLPDDMLPPEPLLMRWMAETDAIERRNIKMNRALISLLSLMADNGLHPVLQKGQGLAALYANPLLRECGDIDLFFASPGEFEAAFRCVEKLDIRMVRKADGSLFYSWQGIPVEHHIRLIDLYHPPHNTKKTDLIWEFRRMALSTASDLEVTVPAPSLNLLLQYAHILKHALGRGIGLRQLCDLALSYDRWHTDLMPDVLKGVCRQAGLTKWVSLLHAFLTECLGLASDLLPYPETAANTQPLLEIIWRGGNFGHQAYRLTRPTLLHKIQTAEAFRRNISFAFRYAPKEALAIFVNLLKGQIR